MRRKDKEIKDQKIIQKILKEAIICRIALCDEGIPYIVPMNFGYHENNLFFHSAPEGRKVDLLRRNDNVCFEMDYKSELLKAKQACQWGMKYYSVIGWGKAIFIQNFKEKIKALDIIMEKYAPDQSFQYEKSQVKLLSLFRIEIDEITGKISGY